MLTLGGICVQPTIIYMEYHVSSSTLIAVGLFQLPALRLELFTGFHVGPSSQCRLFQMYTQNVLFTQYQCIRGSQRYRTI